METIKIKKDPLDTAQNTLRKAQRLVKRVLENTEGTEAALTNGKEIAQFISAVSQLTRAQADLERARTDRDGGIILAGRAILQRLRELMRQDPMLLERFEVLLEQATESELETLGETLSKKIGKPVGKKVAALAAQVEDYLTDEACPTGRGEMLRRPGVDYYAHFPGTENRSEV